ncbi:GntR family transcriptional regulator [Bacillus canaveralius]|uniref:GntR family transcriptional regulator n=1 Tax=Bacillus canaveralius TaxID=1403243 RepID=A0A2N5GPH0_9BACI|nr:MULTISPECIES: PLP-dependent aminotransferase family protein [Bacillus]PLR84609.1 GntR family transcriptional regulator [Bacillus canaveralius]PLR87342.1 GntR family transcriptional regulator [Bacillus sp. V33-4]PLS00761.1 GntR family transcriptional regulator [Bacillus canaveralius]
MPDEEWLPVKASLIPLHQQIYEYMKRKIMAGEWTVGTKIPPQRTLANKFKVNRSTVVFALGELAADGLLESKVGKGTVVINNSWNLLASVPPPDWNSYVQSGAYHPNIRTIQEINEAEKNPNLIRLGTGELAPQLLPSERMKDIFNSSSTFSLGYSEPKGNLYLREMISRYLKKKGIEASPSSILIVSGGLQGLQLISLGLLHRGSTIFLETPSYLNSIQVFQSSGMNLFGIPMNNDGMIIDSLGKLKRQHNGALLYTIPTFHNPTGIVMSEIRRNDLLNVCQKERLPILEDDVYGDLWFDSPPPSPLKASDKQGLVLYMGSMSKTLGPGLRIGWVVGPEPVIDRLADIKMQTDYGSSSLSQFAVAEWLSSGLYEEHVEQIRAELKFRRDLTIDILNKHFHELASWTIPKGGFYIWLSIKLPISYRKLFEEALKEGILLNPGNVYDRNDQQHLRLSYSYAPLNELQKGLIRLSELIKGLI